MGDVTGYRVLLEILEARAWSQSEIAAVAHRNVLRAMRDMEAAVER
jgi:microsomal dipeptidase-like Zn-dependent dipeptidase